MKIPNKPLTIMECMTVLVVTVASIKFLFEGGALTIFGHADSSAYATFLTPVLGAHGYIRAKGQIRPKSRIDNPEQ